MVAAMLSAQKDMAPEPQEGRSEAAVAVAPILLHRLLNTYLREVGGASPLPAAAPDSDGSPGQALRPHGNPIRIDLPLTGKAILAAIRRSSPAGHHEFAGPILVTSGGGAPPVEVTQPLLLADVLLAELTLREGSAATAEERRRELLLDVSRSVESTAIFAAARLEKAAPAPWLRSDGIDGFLGAEQSLVFGHPFHPAPKSSSLLRRADLKRYRPELSASFQLHYFAASPEIVLEDALPGTGEIVSAAVRREAAERTGASRRSWPLLPCHPWQADYLLERPEVAPLLRDGRLVHLGPLGELAHATSSVRTVYLPEQDCFFKLPVDMRITNFVRTNPIEHLRRSLSASRVLAHVERDLPDRRLAILPELAYRGLAPAAWPEELSGAMTPRFAVLVRRGLGREDGPAPKVVAALLEPSLAGEAPIAELVWRASRRRGSPFTSTFVCEWLARYLEVSMLPLLWLFIHRGISLEAHAQNALIALDEGWPVRLYVRDLEGTSISRQRAAGMNHYGHLIAEDSRVLVDDAEAWQRLQYYLFVNHLAHLISSLAAHTRAEEWQLWQVARGLLEDATALAGDAAVAELLSRPDLPAKANLVSRLEGRAERPLYVPIPNPLAAEVMAP
ncbi:IucA/IucC family protein [Sorangium sp. So ce1182]|uniref:IucA/IucC family protein n=1 Tax=Sorangium sp. So ce1182 TaxID=3133334 RepID=UPI003F631928